MNVDPGPAAGYGVGAMLAAAGHAPWWAVVLYAAVVVAIFVVGPVVRTVLDHIALVDLGRLGIAKATQGSIADVATLVHEIRTPRQRRPGRGGRRGRSSDQ